MYLRWKRFLAHSLTLAWMIFHLVCAFERLSLTSVAGKHGYRKMHDNILFMGRASNVRAATKAKTDDFKAKNYNNYTKKIIMAVKAGGVDPVSNRLLHQLLHEAKLANVPKDIIARNIEKATSPSQADFKESVFEFYGHGGVGMLVNVLTDNDNRAAADVLLVAKKNELKQAAINSVAFKFMKKGKLILSQTIHEEELMQVCLDNGIDDYELYNMRDMNDFEDQYSVIYVDTKDMCTLRDLLIEKKHEVTCKLGSVPKEGLITLPADVRDANIAAMIAFEKLDDVDSIDHNMLL